MKYDRSKMVPPGPRHIDTIHFFTYGDCNLACSYCYISKNQEIKNIDKLIEETITNGSQMETVKKTVQDYDAIRRMEFWGGEPTLGFDRIIPQLEEYFIMFPNLKEFFTSTNFVAQKSVDNVVAWLEELHRLDVKYNRDILIEMQISIDGPWEINDKSRGLGTTNRIVKNYQALMDAVAKIDVNLRTGVKPTFTIDALEHVDTEEKIIKYYEFFEKNFRFPTDEVNKTRPKFIVFSASTPNFGVPAEYTKEDGIRFASILPLFKKVEDTGRFDTLFWGNSIIPYVNLIIKKPRLTENNTYKTGLQDDKLVTGWYCSAGTNVLTILPNDQVAICHRGFYDFSEEYESLARSDSKMIVTGYHSNDTIYPAEDFDKLKTRIEAFLCQRHTISRTSGDKVFYYLLAACGDIDKKYMEEEELNKAVHALNLANSCLYANVSNNGSIYINEISIARLFLNGALDFYEEYILENKQKEEEKANNGK